MPEFHPAPASLPTDTRVYAVGDVHGCLHKLKDLHAAIAEDLAARPIARASLVHLGDYVDRGPDPAGVVDWLAREQHPAGLDAVINLTGNHEDLMLAALAAGDADAVDAWMMNGAVASLHSWNVPRAAHPASWVARLPPAHLAFLRSLAVTYAAGGYLFVHAGVRPGVPLEHQTRRDLLWIREPFLSSPGDFAAVVVHGHTPRVAPEIRRNRIGIDTGAVMGGRLTCGVFEADRVAFLTA